MYAEHCSLAAGLARRRLDALGATERALALAGAALGAARTERWRRASAARRSASLRRRHRELAQEAQRLLAADLAAPLALGEVAAVLDTSVFHLCRVFRAEVGSPMHAFRRSLRVRAALRLLGQARLTLYEVADLTGFADRSQLSRAVRAEVGRPPSALR